MSADPRQLAFDVLRAVRQDDAYVNLLLPALLEDRKITGRDAAFATELTNGTIRMEMSYDAIIDSLTKAIDDDVRDVLRIGAHQLLSMRVPDHAAVATTVDLTKKVIGHKPAGLVNAVMRKIAQRDFDQWMDKLNANLSVRYSHPQWIIDAYLAVLPEPEIVSLLESNNKAPAVTLVARSIKPESLPGKPGKLSKYARIIESGNPADIPAVREGKAGVQDEGSQWVVTTLVDVPIVGNDTTWLDMCAGPGGKAALLAAIGGTRGARVVANEVQPHRAELVRKSTATAKNVTVSEHDAREKHWPKESFDRILIDAPCTGLGALRRRPESRWRKQLADVEQLAEIQTALLANAAQLIRPGGVIGYATCSPHIQETSAIVDEFLKDHPNFVRVVPDQQLWPHRDGTDAMFLALLSRR